MAFKHVNASDGAGDTAQCYTTGLACWRHWAPVHSIAIAKQQKEHTGCESHPLSYLFHVKDDNKLQSGNCREEWGEEGSNPADGLPIHNAQDVVWDGKFLLPPALDQLRGRTVGHQEPGNKLDISTSTPKATEPYPPTNVISMVS